MVDFFRKLTAKQIHHGNHPILRWMADNLVVKTDPAGNMKPDKQRSQEKIDGIVSLVMALGAQLRAPIAVQSVYEREDFTPDMVLFG